VKVGACGWLILKGSQEKIKAGLHGFVLVAEPDDDAARGWKRCVASSKSDAAFSFGADDEGVRSGL
jgi:hypothetical protein